MTKENVIKISDLQLIEVRENLLNIGLSLTVSKKAKALISEKGFNSEFGVRFLRREIQSLVKIHYQNCY